MVEDFQGSSPTSAWRCHFSCRPRLHHQVTECSPEASSSLVQTWYGQWSAGANQLTSSSESLPSLPPAACLCSLGCFRRRHPPCQAWSRRPGVRRCFESNTESQDVGLLPQLSSKACHRSKSRYHSESLPRGEVFGCSQMAHIGHTSPGAWCLSLQAFFAKSPRRDGCAPVRSPQACHAGATTSSHGSRCRCDRRAHVRRQRA
mmetsp:Transcript_16732/g.29269  ORF Transcript_16732/g.29269 Transcript_16732/m.29269 type:complete len:203 (+) Transcript_16732:59-667(+)